MAANQEQMESVINRLLDGLDANFDSFEADSVERVINKAQLPVSAKNSLLNRLKIVKEVARQGIPQNKSNVRSAGSALAGQFSIQVTRLTRTINATLPVILFMPELLNNGYRRALQGYLPAGVTLGSVEWGEQQSLPNSVDFTFKEGLNTDVVRVTCKQYPYPSFLTASMNNNYIMDRIRLSIGILADAPAQMQETLIPLDATMFGKGGFDSISIDGNFTPEQNQSAIVDIPAILELDSTKGLLVPVIRASADNYSISFTGFVQAFVRR